MAIKTPGGANMSFFCDGKLKVNECIINTSEWPKNCIVLILAICDLNPDLFQIYTLYFLSPETSGRDVLCPLLCVLGAL